MKITYKQIMKFDPCYDPIEIGMSEDYEADLKDFIIEYRNKVKDLENIIWVCARKEFFNYRDLRLFGVWSTLQVKNLMEDERSLNALEVSEKFAFGLVDKNELAAASDAASAAASAAAWAASDVRGASAARAAAWAAASAAAWAASDVRVARDAAMVASDDWVAARVAAMAAWAASAAKAAAWAAWAASAASAARAAASAAASAAQVEILLKMIEKPNGEWFKDWKEQQ